MQNRSRVAGALSLALGSCLLAGAAAAPQDVTVTLEGLRNPRGQVLACLTAHPGAFPDCRKDPTSHRLVAAIPVQGPLTLEFGPIARGRYAISLIHDENSNGKLDTVLMLPREGFGLSRDARARFGPPSFADAAFAVEDRPVRQSIRVRYMLRTGARD